MVVEFNNGYSFEPGDWLGVDPQYNTTDTTGFPVNVTMYANIENLPYVGLFDINGDHLPDRVMLMNGNHTKWYVQINNGWGFEQKQPFDNVTVPAGAPDDVYWYGIHTVNTGGDTLVGLMDMNGDGLVDRVMSDYNSLIDNATF